MLIFIGIFAVFVEAGVGTFDLPDALGDGENGGYDPNFQKVVFPLFLIGCGVLAGLWPFHTWSPDGHVAAPTAVIDAARGRADEARRVRDHPPRHAAAAGGRRVLDAVLITLATINVLYGAISAMAQTDFKYMVGYSSVSHMGYVLMGLATLNVVGVNGAVLQMFSHGVMTALMFAMVGALYDQAHMRDMRVFGGLVHQMPRFAVFFVIAGLASLGLPGLSGFIAEFNVFVGTFETYPALGALAILGAASRPCTSCGCWRSPSSARRTRRWGDLTDMQAGRAVRRRAADRVHPVHGRVPEPVRRPHQRVRAADSGGRLTMPTS